MKYKKRVIALAFSDLHLHWWQKFNKNGIRTNHQFKILLKLYNECVKYKVPALFCGDLINDPYSISNKLLDHLTESFARLNKKNLNSKYKVKIYSISGNHDQSDLSFIDRYPSNYIKSFSRLCEWLVCTDYTSIETKDFVVHGIPYISENIGLDKYISKMNLHINKPNILLLHTDYAGAKDTSGREVASSSVANDSMVSIFDLVLCGHIHLHQKLSKKDIYMVGAPNQQNRGDRFIEQMGYLKIYSDMSVEMVPIKSPCFVDVISESEIDNDKDYFTVIKVNTEVYNNNISKAKKGKDVSNKKIVNMYCKDKGIEKPKKRLLKKILMK